MMKFNTISEAVAASLAIGAEIQKKGQKINPNYKCDKWADVEKVGDGYGFPHTHVADDLGIKYEEFYD